VCRLLAYVSPHARTALDVLGREHLDRFAELASLHCDGWGIAWVDQPGGAVQRHRSISPAHRDPTFSELIRTKRAVAIGLHLRWATAGMPVTDANSHPFIRGGLALLHNGSITPVAQLDNLLRPASRDPLEGGTDSERYLALIEQHHSTGVTLTDALTAAVGEIRPMYPQASLNAVVLNKFSMVVVHASSGAANPPPLTEFLTRSQDTEVPLDHDTAYFHMRWRTERDGTVLVASTGLNHDGWTDLPADSITTVDLIDTAIAQRRPVAEYMG
jgi:gamma-glutamyl hercynylcysteine S-oxide hydrolase